jgi:hypothetical protein
VPSNPPDGVGEGPGDGVGVGLGVGFGVVPLCVTFTVLVAISIEPTRCDELVFAATEKRTDPLPGPPLTDVMVM